MKKTSHELEWNLLRRLKLMSYIFFVLAGASLCFVLLKEDTEPTEQTPLATIDADETSLDTNPHDIFNFYLITALFISLGGLCYWIDKKKRRSLQREE